VAGFPQPDQLPHVELLNLGLVAQVFQRPFPEPARQQQPGELVTQAVGPVTRRILGQATARPSLRVGAPPGVAEHRDDLAVLPGAMQVLGQHCDARVDVTRKRGQLLPQELDADRRPRVRINRFASATRASATYPSNRR
jgi:hypothetical protein